MRHHREDVVGRALAVLDEYGLADLSMRRIGAELEIRASALYHHFPSKQALLAAVADEILSRGHWPEQDGAWDAAARAHCLALRDAMLAYRDGAEVVATVHAYGLGAQSAYDGLLVGLGRGGFDPVVTRTAARTLLHFVLGHVADEQTHLQAAGAGAIDDTVDGRRTSADFDLGLDLILDGLRVRAVA